MMQIEFLLLHAQLKRCMMKGLKMLLYQHFQESTVTFSKLKHKSEFFSPFPASLQILFFNPSNNFNFLVATIFAYGQTSSGKTFTMRGITENAIRDIYDCIKNVSDYLYYSLFQLYLEREAG